MEINANKNSPAYIYALRAKIARKHRQTPLPLFFSELPTEEVTADTLYKGYICRTVTTDVDNKTDSFITIMLFDNSKTDSYVETQMNAQLAKLSQYINPPDQSDEVVSISLGIAYESMTAEEKAEFDSYYEITDSNQEDTNGNGATDTDTDGSAETQGGCMGTVILVASILLALIGTLIMFA